MILRVLEHEEKYLADSIKLFREVVHCVNFKDYTKNQLDTWAPEIVDTLKWKDRIKNNYIIIAKDGNKIIGFGELSPKGSIDMIYVHGDYLRQKIGQKLLECLVKKAKQLNLNSVFTEASITTKPFFENQGFKLIKEHVKTINYADFINYTMKKVI